MTLPTRTARLLVDFSIFSSLSLTNITTSYRLVLFSFLSFHRGRRGEGIIGGLIEYRGRDIGHVIGPPSSLSFSLLPFFLLHIFSLLLIFKQSVRYHRVSVRLYIYIYIYFGIYDRAEFANGSCFFYTYITRPNID